MKNDKWDKRFMKIAYDVATWSSCIRNKRQVGAVIVKNNRIVATGYNGAPSGIDSCAERGECLRTKLHIPSGQRQELCYATHGEQNALIQAAKLGISVDGATMYVTHRPCAICTKLIINAGIKRIVYAYDYPDEFSTKLLEQAGVVLHQLTLNTVEEQICLKIREKLKGLLTICGGQATEKEIDEANGYNNCLVDVVSIIQKIEEGDRV